MKIRGVSVLVLAEALGTFLLVRARSARRQLVSLLQETQGRKELSPEELRIAKVTDAFLKRLRIRCLRRSLVVARMLHRRGIAVRVRLSLISTTPHEAHAVVEVGGQPVAGEIPSLARFE